MADADLDEALLRTVRIRGYWMPDPETDDVRTVRRLLDDGADVNGVDGRGRPLSCAAYSGHTRCVRLLLERGADPNRLNGDMTALKHAANMCRLGVTRALLKGGTHVDQRSN